MHIQDPGRETILAGGGLVENERGEILFMFRRNTWDLPKGKQDAGESLEACALREVKEETGIGGISIAGFLLITRHDYEENGRKLIKETHWFRMRASGNQSLVPQVEEDITELKWIGQDGLSLVRENTFPSILDVLRAAGYDPG